MEQLVPDAGQRLLDQGVLGVLLLMAIVAIGWLVRRVVHLEAKNDEALERLIGKAEKGAEKWAEVAGASLTSALNKGRRDDP